MRVLGPLFVVFLGATTLTAMGLPPQSARPMSFTATLTSVHVTVRPGQVVTRQFQLTLDPGQRRTQFRARVEDWWRSRDGAQSFYGPPGTLRRSCAPWASVNPVEAAVEPGGTLTVRVSVAVPRELGTGGYWCALTVDEVPDPEANATGVGVKFVASVSTGIFLYTDPVERSATILDARVVGDRAVVTLRNTGNAPLGVEGRLEFFRRGEASPVAAMTLPRSTMLPEPVTDGDIPIPLPPPADLPSGTYRLRVVLDIGAAFNIGAERDVTVTRATAQHAAIR